MNARRFQVGVRRGLSGDRTQAAATDDGQEDGPHHATHMADGASKAI
jgi:hypothetical protein